MFLLIATAAAAAMPSPPRPVQAQAKAVVRIVRPAIASSKAWDLSPKGSRKETIRKDERGDPVLLRLIEYP